jgi:opacity protein-like surface antigen
MRLFIKIVLCFLLLLLATAENIFAREKSYIREYTYQASEDDSENTAREKALTQVTKLLLREVGEYLRSEQILSSSNSTTQEYTERVESVTAGIVKTKILKEEWNSEKSTFYLKVEMTVDPDEVKKYLSEVQKAKEENVRLRQIIADSQKQNIEKTTEEYQRSFREYQQNADLLNSLTQQYFEVECSLAGATIKIDDEEFVPITNGKFQKRLSFGSHKYTVNAPLYYPLEGYVGITREKQSPLRPILKPMFGELRINSTPESGADVFIDDERRGVTPLIIPQLRSGNHIVSVQKNMYLPATKTILITDGASREETITLIPNFANITLKADGDIYINDSRKETNTWRGRLLPGTYKVEVRKNSHRTTIKNLEVKAREEQTIQLDAPTPIFGSLDISAKIKADIYIDGLKRKETTPAVISEVLIGTHEIKLVASGYADYQRTVEVRENRIEKVEGDLKKSATLYIKTNVPANVSIDGGITTRGTKIQTILTDLPIKEIELLLTQGGYKPLKKYIRLKAGDNHFHGKLKKEIQQLWFVDYVYSKVAPLGLNIGYCKQWGLYLGFKTNNKPIVKEADFETVDFNKKGYHRLSITAGPVLRLCNWCYLYCGAGYGTYGAAYQVGGQKDYYCPYSQKGLDVEGGIKIKLSSIFLSVGYNTLLLSGDSQPFRDVNIGVGLNF